LDLKLQGKSALVTGASAGIGREIAKQLALEGVAVMIVARRREHLNALADEIVSLGGIAPTVVVQDVTAHDASKKIRSSAQEFGQIDIIINNAGQSEPTSMDTTDEDWEHSMVLNYLRPRQLTHALLPDMIKAGWGRVINITGIGEPTGLNATLPAKAAMHSWSKGLSRDLAKNGITVNCIPPGRILTEQASRYSPEKMQAFCDAEIPMGRFGEVEELAVLAVFLASPLASYITGAVINVDGGLGRFQF
jgi:3-oxoacyl-[acyl-carrier protein] reductase